MIWKSVMIAADYEAPFFNWKHILSGIDVDRFRAEYLDPAQGYCGIVTCSEFGKCEVSDCTGLKIRNLSTGTTACCPHKFLGPRIPVTQADIAKYALSSPRFHKAVCEKLGLEFTNTPMEKFFWELGTHKAGTCKLVPVYISYYIASYLLTNELKELFLQKPDARFVLVVYDNSLVEPVAAKMLRDHNCVCVSMAELFTMNADCSLTLQTMPEQIFGRFKGDETIVSMNTYPCPVGTKWSDIHINFLDRETLTVWRRGEASMAVSYAMLGMASKRTNKATMGFKFLALSLEKKETSWPVPAKATDEYKELVQRKREINNSLKSFFSNIQDGDPIEFVKSSNSYEFRFQSRTI